MTCFRYGTLLLRPSETNCVFGFMLAHSIFDTLFIVISLTPIIRIISLLLLSTPREVYCTLYLRQRRILWSLLVHHRVTTVQTSLFGVDYISYDPPTELAPIKIESIDLYPAPIDDGVIGEPYDPHRDWDGFFDQLIQDPQEEAAAPVAEEPIEDLMEEDEADAEMVDTDTGKEDVSEDDEHSAGSGSAGAEGRSEISTDTHESCA
ncbi:hypothetical protein PIB30_076448 [Stylosanthes scabra]|uniref:Uncharacterized protein n=1 Tax=Stylosanthes scabra TaxID=79078 RepID=A0ABU6WRH0_9FABA|nr:hypothetical protein [Stylosanthes scabra]